MKVWKSRCALLCGLTLMAFFGAPATISAADLSSTNFIVRDPIVGGGGGFGTSSTFQLFSDTDLTLTGTGSFSSFLGRLGFLYFPFVTAATPSATAGDGSVVLSWGASSAGLGYSVGGYQVGYSTTSGSGYTFVSVGVVTTHTQGALANGTPYYFVVRTLDAFGNVIATSSEVSATPAGSGGAPTSGSASVYGIKTGVFFSGWAYPGASVTILKNTVRRTTVTAGADARFEAVLEETYDQEALYTLLAEDADGERSLLLNYPVAIASGLVVEIKNVRFAPTIALDKQQVRPGSALSLFGFALPSTAMEFIMEPSSGRPSPSERGVFQSFSDGRFRYAHTSALPRGDYTLRVHYPEDQRMSRALKIVVAGQDVPSIPDALPTDCNRDRVVDLKDFSILAYWYEKRNPPVCVDTNGDGRVNLIDFSILAFYWSG